MAIDQINDEPGATAAQAGDQAAAAGIDPDAGVEYINAINNLIVTQFQGGALRTQMQTQPCSAAGFIREIMATTLEPKVTWRHGWADKAEQFLSGWVRESIQRQGRFVPGIDGNKSLARFMIEAGPRVGFGSALLPPGPRAALVGPLAEADWIQRGHLPSGQELASGAWIQATSAPAEVRNNGEKLSNGVYLYPAVDPFNPERSGSKLRGPKVSALIWDWIQYQAENVSGTLGQGWNGTLPPRATLIKMVGTFKGTGPYGLWQDSDGARPGSRVYQIDLLWNDAQELLEESSDLCTDEWTLSQQMAESEAALQEAERIAALDAARRKADREQTAFLGALAVVALFLVFE
jgi:hypothetical protein